MIKNPFVMNYLNSIDGGSSLEAVSVSLASYAACIASTSRKFITTLSGHPGKTRGLKQDFSLFVTDVNDLQIRTTQSSILSVLTSLMMKTISLKQASRLLHVSDEHIKSLRELLQTKLRKRVFHIRKSLSNCTISNPRKLQIQDMQDELSCDVDLKEDKHSKLEDREARLAQMLSNKRQPRLYIVLENPANQGNVAAIMRLCDGFGVEELLLIGCEHMDFKTMHKRSASSCKWVQYSVHATLGACSEYIQTEVKKRHEARYEEGAKLQMYATAVHSKNPTTLYDIDFCFQSQNPKTLNFNGVVVWFGNELDGLSEEACNLCPSHVFIPMMGMVESYNLGTSVACILSEITRQRLDFKNSNPSALN